MDEKIINYMGKDLKNIFKCSQYVKKILITYILINNNNLYESNSIIIYKFIYQKI